MEVLKVVKLLAISFIVLILSACVREDRFPVNTHIVCDAERTTQSGKFIAANDSTAFFEGGKQQSGLSSFSGKYSVITTPKKGAFALAYTIKRAGPDWYFKVSVWRKSKDGKGVLVVSGKESGKFYEATSEAVGEQKEGWEKLEMEVYTPPWFNSDQITFYVWNNSSDTVFFDDLSIRRLEKKTYPDFNEEPIALVLDTSDVIKIRDKRKKAFKEGILVSADNDWVKAIVFEGDKMMKAKLRLKGDWLDHLKGDKWSFRIKMKKEYAWRHLRTFSVQTPAARDYLREWEAHQYFRSLDVLTTRYGFIPLVFNNQNRGLYAWEEHFDKQLLESRNRREGPILKFSEDAFWQEQKVNMMQRDKWVTLPYFEAAVIKPFKQSKTLRNTGLKLQFENAQKLVQQYKTHSKTPDEIFDLKKLANYFAVADLANIKHGMAWHNQRFYFNPVLCKIEPVAFDCYSENPIFSQGLDIFYAYSSLFTEETVSAESYLISDLFTDSSFLNEYLESLGRVSSTSFIQQVDDSLTTYLSHYDSLLKLEFPYYNYDKDFIARNADTIRKYLPELKQLVKEKSGSQKFSFNVEKKRYSDTTIYGDSPAYLVNAYLEKTEGDSIVISIYNYCPKKITLLGTGRKKSYVDYFFYPEPSLERYDGSKEVSGTFRADTNAVYLLFIVDGRFDTYSVPINPWPFPKGLTPQQELMETVNLDNEKWIRKRDGKNIYVKQGDVKVDRPIVIPKGYKVHFDKGTRLNLTDGAMFISYSPVMMRGSEKEPVIITSADFSGNGFTVLQAAEKSIVDHVKFENLNTLDYKGWTLTGAVTFYESDVDISNTTFYRNQCEDALNTIRSNFRVTATRFDYIYSDAFDSDFCTGKLDNAEFKNIGNDAIDFSGSTILIKDVVIEDVNDKGISGGEASNLTVVNPVIRRANIGLASKDLSRIRCTGGTITDCVYGLVLLQKKPEYGPATMYLERTQLQNAKTDMLIETGSQVTMNGKTIKGKKEKLADIFYK